MRPTCAKMQQDRAFSARFGPVCAAAVVVASGLCLALPVNAHANEYGSKETAADASASTTAPSGFKATFQVTDLLGDQSGDAVPVTTLADIYDGKHVPALANGTKGVALGVTGASNGVYSYPTQWSFDQEWHPAAKITLTFERPVVNPSIPLGGYLVAALHQTDNRNDGKGTSGVQLTFGGAQGPAGNVPISISPQAGFNVDSYDVTATTITPKRHNGKIPYLSSYALYCEAASGKPGPITNDSGMSEWLNSHLPGITYVAAPCGTIKVDTGGSAITSLTIQQDLTYAAAFTANDVPTKWNGATLNGTVLSFSVPTEVSGSATPESFGAATHVVSTLAIGTAKDSPAIQPAFATRNLVSAHGGTPSDNSDGGYAEESSLGAAALTSDSTGQFTLDVPYRGLSQNAYLNGWIDFNGDGTWEPAEQASAIATIDHKAGANQSGSAKLRFALPSDLQAGTTAWLRLRLAYDRDDVAVPTGMARSGEVEDHALRVGAPAPAGAADLVVEKRGPATAQAGSRITYTITVTNKGTAPSTTDATVTDLLPAAIDPKTVRVQSAPASAAISRAGSTITWRLPAGVKPASAGVTYQATISGTIAANAKPGNMRNTAALSPTPECATTCTSSVDTRVVESPDGPVGGDDEGTTSDDTTATLPYTGIEAWSVMVVASALLIAGLALRVLRRGERSGRRVGARHRM